VSPGHKEAQRKAIKVAKKDEASIMDDFWLWICNSGKFTDEHVTLIRNRKKRVTLKEKS